jgi:hypothetical protein
LARATKREIEDEEEEARKRADGEDEEFHLRVEEMA